MIVLFYQMDAILDTQTAICKVPLHLVKEEETYKVEVAKVRQVLWNMQKVTSDLISLGFGSVNDDHPLDSSVAYAKFSVLNPACIYIYIYSLFYLPRDIYQISIVVPLQ